MKMLLSLILSLALLISCMPGFAEAPVEPENRIYAVDSAYLNLANMSPQFKGGEASERGCLGLQPFRNQDDTFADGHMMFAVTVETAGLYNVTIRYAAKAKEGQIRCADLIVNQGERIALPIEAQADWNIYMDAVVTVELIEGVNTLILTNVEGFDNSVYKAINVDYIEWVPTPEAPAAE